MDDRRIHGAISKERDRTVSRCDDAAALLTAQLHASAGPRRWALDHQKSKFKRESARRVARFQRVRAGLRWLTC